MARKMQSGLLLGLLLCTAMHPGLLGTAAVRSLHLCEGYVGPDGRYHPGFYCPRLGDPGSHRYCCRPGPHALKSCCARPAREALARENRSSVPAPGLLRNPLALPVVGLYGVLVLLLMAVDLLHFHHRQRCHLSRLLPRGRLTPPARSPGSPRSPAPRAERPPARSPRTPAPRPARSPRSPAPRAERPPPGRRGLSAPRPEPPDPRAEG
ncbi:protein shisa-like-1 [Rhea pennata]|uniref:protein shisa-like-1 n=1 Tax=Rhea pennata TaxID=8795 RepID=UPI002E2665F7